MIKIIAYSFKRKHQILVYWKNKLLLQIALFLILMILSLCNCSHVIAADQWRATVGGDQESSGAADWLAGKRQVCITPPELDGGAGHGPWEFLVFIIVVFVWWKCVCCEGPRMVACRVVAAGAPWSGDPEKKKRRRGKGVWPLTSRSQGEPRLFMWPCCWSGPTLYFIN